MIEVRDLARVGSVDAVKGVSFTARDGTITGLIGENGAGKTTTLTMIGGVVPADAGIGVLGTDPTIRIDGDASLSSLDHRRRLGTLLDHKGLYAQLTALENIQYFAALHGLSGAELRQRLTDTAARFGCGDLMDRRVADFSQGEHMKVALGRATVHRPRNLLLDEPTNGLDVSVVRALRRWLREMRDQRIRLGDREGGVFDFARLAFYFRQRRTLGELLTSNSAIAVWIVTVVLAAMAVRRGRELRRELRNLHTLQRQLMCNGSD
jgi:sodium transport system ATP-binding protein